MEELHTAISKLQTLHPEAGFIVVDGFNVYNLKTLPLEFHQHVSCPTTRQDAGPCLHKNG